MPYDPKEDARIRRELEQMDDSLIDLPEGRANEMDREKSSEEPEKGQEIDSGEKSQGEDLAKIAALLEQIASMIAGLPDEIAAALGVD